MTISAAEPPRDVTTQWTNPTEAGVAWDSGAYLYDRSGNIAAIGKDLFAYDGANRLTSSVVHAHGVATSQSFDFDRYSNLLAMTTSIGRGLDWTHPFTATLDVDATTNQVREVCSTPPCREFEYDAAGNQTQFGAVTYSWDATGAMTELTAGTTHERYVYDANGERILTVSLDGNDAEVVRRWTWRDATNKVAREAVEHVGAGMWSEARDYVHRDGSLLASFDSATSPVADRHYHLDHLGTPRLTTDASGNELSTDVYLPFGGRAAGTDTDVIGYKERLRFTGHERDGENSPDRPVLDYMHARYYTPQWGRFLSVDPTWESADLTLPQTWNRYAYVRNNPIKLVDPDGAYAIAWWLFRTAAQYAAREIAMEAGRTVLEGTKIYAMQVLSERQLMPQPQVIPPILSAKDPYAIDDTRISRIPDDRISAPPDVRGNAPTGDDGFPIEIHHVDQKPDSPLVEMTRTDHRGTGNFKRNHDNTGQEPSKIDRKKWKETVKTYWQREWDRGRFRPDPLPATVRPLME